MAFRPTFATFILCYLLVAQWLLVLGDHGLNLHRGENSFFVFELQSYDCRLELIHEYAR